MQIIFEFPAEFPFSQFTFLILHACAHNALFILRFSLFVCFQLQLFVRFSLPSRLSFPHHFPLLILILTSAATQKPQTMPQSQCQDVLGRTVFPPSLPCLPLLFLKKLMPCKTQKSMLLKSNFTHKLTPRPHCHSSWAWQLKASQLADGSADNRSSWAWHCTVHRVRGREAERGSELRLTSV